MSEAGHKGGGRVLVMKEGWGTKGTIKAFPRAVL